MFIGKIYKATLDFLIEKIFPIIVAYATHPLIILATIGLLYPLVAFSSNTSLALVLGNYTNVVSASVASIVLLQSMRQQRETERLDRRVREMHEQSRDHHAETHRRLEAIESKQTKTKNPTKPSAN